MYLERFAYKKLLEWKRQSHATLEVSGARQVGKTYLVNKFADEQYNQKIYINLLELSGELLINFHKELMEEMIKGRRYENPVHELILTYLSKKSPTSKVGDELRLGHLINTE